VCTKLDIYVFIKLYEKFVDINGINYFNFLFIIFFIISVVSAVSTVKYVPLRRVYRWCIYNFDQMWLSIWLLTTVPNVFR
jgi:hypothetical protein